MSKGKNQGVDCCMQASTKTEGSIKTVAFRRCPICGGQHAVNGCSDFNGASPPDRWRHVRRHRLCFSCLRSGHMQHESKHMQACNKHGECQLNVCRKRQHRLLHGVDDQRRRSPQRSSDRSYSERNQQLPISRRSLDRGAPQAAEGTVQRILSCVDAERDRLLFRILPVTLYGAGRRVDTYALLDEGSSITMIDNELRKELSVQGERRHLNIQWFGGRSTREPSNVVSLQISGAGKPIRHALRNVYSVSNLSLPMKTLHRRDVQGVHKDARLPMRPYSNVVPKLLIGLDHGHLGLPLRTRRFARQGPYAATTELGWVVFGPTSGQSTTPRYCFLAVSLDDTIQRMVEDYFDVENFGVKLAPPVAGSDDVRAQKTLEDTTVRVGQRYQTGLLWKDDYIVLPQSYDMAYKRLVNVEKKMKRNGQFAQEYTSGSGRLWYLPHFGVENPNKPGKIRLLFNAAARVGGTSLNSALAKGPQHYKP
ncbi:uncharacterized protein LOC111075280 [Drosophila obscura]|uniref:uncharacterized protein LOC111075280 n=1 Tax=Drosophila obscura TaxID=7282 RepID=UPI001BB2CC5B|nr:uncharacterized protein LOC111075280 [Drosophila obscura]